MNELTEEQQKILRESQMQEIYRKKKEWHEAQRHLPIKEKMRILLILQEYALPLIKAKRPLKPHEKVWPIDP